MMQGSCTAAGSTNAGINSRGTCAAGSTNAGINSRSTSAGGSTDVGSNAAVRDVGFTVVAHCKEDAEGEEEL